MRCRSAVGTTAHGRHRGSCVCGTAPPQQRGATSRGVGDERARRRDTEQDAAYPQARAPSGWSEGQSHQRRGRPPQRKLRTGLTYWQSRPLPHIPVAPLRADRTTEVLVIGAGMTGAMAAEALTAAVWRVTLVDRRGRSKARPRRRPRCSSMKSTCR